MFAGHHRRRIGRQCTSTLLSQSRSCSHSLESLLVVPRAYSLYRNLPRVSRGRFRPVLKRKIRKWFGRLYIPPLVFSRRAPAFGRAYARQPRNSTCSSSGADQFVTAVIGTRCQRERVNVAALGNGLLDFRTTGARLIAPLCNIVHLTRYTREVGVGPAAPSRHTVCSYGFAGSERSREVNVRGASRELRA